MRSATACLLIAAALTGMPAVAPAQPVSGFYVSGALGPIFQHNRSVTSPAELEFAPAPVPVDPSSSNPATGARGSIGYGLGNGLRFELEGSGSASRLRLPQGP